MSLLAIMLVVSDTTTTVQAAFRLHTKHKQELLFAMMRMLADSDALISFEGELSNTELVNIAGATFSETRLLKRNTTSPKLDFVVLPLTTSIVSAIEKAAVSKISFKGYRGIVHVQIEKQGRLIFAAYDHFHEECVWASSDVSASVLADLVEKRVLYSYKSV